VIIEDRNVDDIYLLRTPVYLLTGDIETAKFYSNLASACSKMGYFVENTIVDLITLPIIKYENLIGYDKKCVVVKPKIEGMIPDFLVCDPLNKSISIYEVKTNLKNLDSKQAVAEKNKHEKLHQLFSSLFPSFDVTMYIVDFIEGPSLKVNLYEKDSLLKTIDGRVFCKHLEVEYDDVLQKITEYQNINIEFIKQYKNKNIEIHPVPKKVNTTLEVFYE
jgi:hypothetical protein